MPEAIAHEIRQWLAIGFDQMVVVRPLARILVLALVIVTCAVLSLEREWGLLVPAVAMMAMLLNPCRVQLRRTVDPARYASAGGVVERAAFWLLGLLELPFRSAGRVCRCHRKAWALRCSRRPRVCTWIRSRLGLLERAYELHRPDTMDIVKEALGRMRSLLNRDDAVTMGFCYFSCTGQRSEKNDDYYLFIAGWLFSPLLLDKLWHEVEHHCDAIERQYRYKVNVMELEYAGKLSFRDKLAIERTVRRKVPIPSWRQRPLRRAAAEYRAVARDLDDGRPLAIVQASVALCFLAALAYHAWLALFG